MNIKTITTWADYNYGASLQAYALLAFLRSRGHEAELICYLPPYQRRMYDYWWVNPESRASRHWLTRWLYRVAKFLQRMTTLKRKRAFDAFNFGTLPLTGTRYRCYSELRQAPPQADLYIVGSDQVWNVLYEAGRDPAFFLEFVREGRKASYAASFSYLDLDEACRQRIARSLESFEGVAVREFHGVELLRSMGVESTWVLDPVFLLPVAEWKRFVDEHTVSSESWNEPYLLVYDFEGNGQLETFVLKYARERGLRLYAITDKRPLRYVDKNFRHAGPADFVRLIMGCAAFVSNSFHGTAFAIMFHKPVFVFGRHRHKVNSRMESLLAAFGLQDCLLQSEEEMECALHKVFDWEKVEAQRKQRLAASLDYLYQLGV